MYLIALELFLRHRDVRDHIDRKNTILPRKKSLGKSMHLFKKLTIRFIYTYNLLRVVFNFGILNQISKRFPHHNHTAKIAKIQ